jgi:hypothetical protein
MDRAHACIGGTAAAAVEVGDVVSRGERRVGEGAAQEDRSAQDQDAHRGIL